MEVTGEMKIHLLHWHHLRITAARCTALHAETGTKRGLSYADHCVFTNGIQAVTQTDRCGRLAFTGGGWIDCGNQDQLAVVLALLCLDKLIRDLCLVVSIRHQRLGGNAQFTTNFENRFLAGFARYFYISFYGHVFSCGVALKNLLYRQLQAYRKRPIRSQQPWRRL